MPSPEIRQSGCRLKNSRSSGTIETNLIRMVTFASIYRKLGNSCDVR